MRWASAVSTQGSLEAALREAADVVRHALAGVTPDLAVAFVSEQHADEYERVPALLRTVLAPRVVIGCSAGGVIGGGREVERRAGVSLTAAVLPAVELAPFHLDAESAPPPHAPAARWETAVGVDRDRQPAFLLLPDPFTFDA